jgi:hypothetical protein
MIELLISIEAGLGQLNTAVPSLSLSLSFRRYWRKSALPRGCGNIGDEGDESIVVAADAQVRADDRDRNLAISLGRGEKNSVPILAAKETMIMMRQNTFT